MIREVSIDGVVYQFTDVIAVASLKVYIIHASPARAHVGSFKTSL